MALGRSSMRIRAAAFAISSCAALVCIALVGLGWHSGDRAVELFNWSQWSAKQNSLMKEADAVTGEARSGLRSRGEAIKQGLSKVAQLLRPEMEPPSHKIMSMDQALAMLKVQRQMRHEERGKFSSDRIQGAGDVAGLEGEQDERDEQNALMEPDSGPDDDVSNLFENCEDGSLSAEDAELCSRRASAIKLLTKAAVQSQLLDSEKMKPRFHVLKATSSGKPDAVESAARKELITDALIGQEYLERLKQRNEAKLAGPKTNQLAGHKHSTSSALSKTPQLNSHPESSVSSRSQHSIVIRKHAKNRAKKENSIRSKDMDKTAQSTQNGSQSRVGDLSALSNIEEAAQEHGSQSLSKLESQIDSTEKELDQKKMAFTKEMARRQQKLQRQFLKSMQDIRTGLALVDGVSVPVLGSNSKQSLKEAQAAYLRQVTAEALAGQPILPSQAVQVAGPAGSSASALQGQQTGVNAILQKVEQSKLFQHPPQPKKVHKTLTPEENERETLQAALDQQFDEVASDRPDTTRRQDEIKSLKDENHRYKKREAKEREKLAQAKQQRRVIQGLRQIQNRRKEAKLPSYQKELARGEKVHIGTASYQDLTKWARQDMKLAEKGQPVLHKALQDAIQADTENPEVGPAAQLEDAEKVLCSVGDLKRGLCSSGHLPPRKPVRRVLRNPVAAGKGKVQRRVRQPPSVATLAKDVGSSIEGFFSRNGMMN